MNDSIYRISMDIHEHGSQAVLKAKKTDTGRKLHISLRAGGTSYIIADDCYAVFKATKPDGSILYNACTIENNEIIYEFTEQTCTAVGRCQCEIALYGFDDKIITSPRFALLVDGLIYPDEDVESQSEFSALTKLVTDSLEATDSANTAAKNANEEAEYAQTVADEARREAESAFNAAREARQATADATNAAQDATESADSANEATDRANAATTAANNAAENANETATNLVRIVKNAMAVGEVFGTNISLDDAVELSFAGFRIFGKTTQNGTPTPDAPVDLVSVGDSGSITVNVTGGNEAKSMTVATPNGLPGIPVPSGGNYTDANGQQWICDEIDLASGVYVQRVGKDILDGVTAVVAKNDSNSNEYLYYYRPANVKQNAHGYCTHFRHSDILPANAGYHGAFNLTIYSVIYLNGYGIVSGDNGTLSDPSEFNNWLNAQYNAGTPVTVLYILATPIEIPLTEEEIAAFAALHAYRNNTTVSNDAGAWMNLEYVMDAKKYIDSLVTGSMYPATVE